MKLLLDTCAILWIATDANELSKKTKKLLVEPSNDIFVLPISCAEIACLTERKKIRLDQHWKLWFRQIIENNGWNLLSIDLLTIEEAYSLPDAFHRDPVDRMLVAAARLHQATIVTGDKLILNYPHVDSIC